MCPVCGLMAKYKYKDKDSQLIDGIRDLTDANSRSILKRFLRA